MLKILLVAILALPATSLYAATCADSNIIKNQLKEKFGEELILQSEAINDRHIQVWRNNETGTWSVFVTTLDNLHCLIGSGKGKIWGLS